MGRFEGKTVIITGASSGIGRESAYLFAREGANLVLTARTEKKLEEIAERCETLGGKAVWFAGDCRDEATAVGTVDLAVKRFGQIDILVNNAGIGKVKSIVESTVEDYYEIMDTNVKSAFLFTKYTVPEMLKAGNGQIVMVSSVTGIRGHDAEMLYAGTKFALRGFAQSVDIELRDKGIKCCAICPNAVKTAFEIGEGRTEESIAQKQWLLPEDVADAIVYACTTDPRYRITEIRLSGRGSSNF